jgi:hypothetical protein
MRLYEYAFRGDPKAQLAAWSRVVDGSHGELLFNVVTERPDGITVLDVCPTEQDFDGWIHGDAWRSIKTELGGDVAVTFLGEVRGAVARDGLVEIVTHAHA